MGFLWRCCCYGAILITISTSTLAYNFDVDNLIIYEDATTFGRSRESYSGFSVALWNPGQKGIENSWIFIGAPRANSSAYKRSNEPGTVFKCKIGQRCEEWIMDSGDRKGPGDGTWLGGSMKIGNGPDARVVVCGPRWLDLSQPGVNPNAWPMKGICYQANAGSNTRGVPLPSPLKDFFTNNWLSDVMTEIGFSVHIVPDADPTIIFGSPGWYYGHGASIKTRSSESPPSIEYTPLGSFLKSNSYDVDYNAYLGYAVTSGYYLGQKNDRLYATSAPRSANLYGQVFIYDSDGNEIGHIMAPQIVTEKKHQVGEYFGSALASCDIDGDGSDDLIVGAPHWTKIVDEGRVLVFKENADRKLEEPQILEGGMTVRARFGTAITCLGDIDHDGYEDLAVGAPYEGNGTVYIYHGGKYGLKLTQRITAPKDTKGFGISISEPRDIDNNDHVDIAVGAYLSGHVILLRSKRAVTTKVTLSIGESEKSLQTNATSFTINVCSFYDGKYAPKTLTVIKELKVDEILQRAEIEVAGIQRVYKFTDTLELGKETCQEFKINIKKRNGNFRDPLALSVVQRLNTSNQNGTLSIGSSVTGEEHFDSNSAVTNELHALATDHKEVAFVSKCNNKICNSHLLIQMVTNLRNGDTYVIGSGSYIELNITVTNTGDLAFLTKVDVIIPPFFQLRHIPPTCTQEPIDKMLIVTCDIANPLGTNEMKNINLSLDIMSLSTSSTTKMTATATTLSHDAADGHKKTLPINIVEETDIGIARKVTADRYSYSLLSKEEEQLPNIAFQQVYEIKNYQVSPIAEALLSVSFPTHWLYADSEVEIVRLNKTTGFLYGEEFKCTEAEANTNISSASYDATTHTEWLNGSNDAMTMGQKPDEKFTIIHGKVVAASPDNRTLHVNCTNPSIKWKTINCKLKSFKNTQYVAKLALMFDLLLSNFTSEIIEDKDIIFFATNGSVKMVQPSIETIHKEPDLIMIGTMFVGSPPESRVQSWIIVVSVLVGLLLLILVILALVKFGFFKRTKQMELKALLKEKDEVSPDWYPNWQQRQAIVSTQGIPNTVAESAPGGETSNST